MCNSHVTVFRFSVSRFTKTHSVATASVFLLLFLLLTGLLYESFTNQESYAYKRRYTTQRQPRNTKNTFPEVAEQ
jgi:hypothetical protein